MSDNDIYYIERILDRRNVNGRLEYKIKWEGYPMSQSTWEPLENLKTAIELVEEYDKLHPLPPPDLMEKALEEEKKLAELKEQRKKQLQNILKSWSTIRICSLMKAPCRHVLIMRAIKKPN